MFQEYRTNMLKLLQKKKPKLLAEYFMKQLETYSEAVVHVLGARLSYAGVRQVNLVKDDRLQRKIGGGEKKRLFQNTC